MRNDPDQAPGLLQVLQRLDRKIQRFRVQRAEAFIDEDRVQPDPPAYDCTTSDSPSASASDARNDSPPDRVLTARVVPV